jgi:hypothetical protein
MEGDASAPNTPTYALHTRCANLDERINIGESDLEDTSEDSEDGKEDA